MPLSQAEQWLLRIPSIFTWMLSPTNRLLLALLAPNKFLPMQLTNVGKTAQSLPKLKFPESFSLSANPKHFSNTTESLKLLDEIIIPYDKSERERLKLEPSQLALLILDIFSGQMTTPVMDKLAENHIKYVKVPTKMTNYFNRWIWQSIKVPQFSWRKSSPNGIVLKLIRLIRLIR